jgi:hypothetical protein
MSVCKLIFAGEITPVEAKTSIRFELGLAREFPDGRQ